ncbi:MAG TPA: hypothetical protein VHS96_17890 [Bacteroidia bacterium]|nr:hypothetical protein [Bacteroidia bacterium]
MKIISPMKLLRYLFLALFMAMGMHTAWADVAREGEVEVKVELMNGKFFPDYEFFVRYQGYYYNQGYHPSEPVDLILAPGESFTTGSKGGSSYLYARDSSGNIYESETKVGGVAKDFSPNVGYHLHQIQVLSVRDGVVKFKIVARKKMTDEGKVIKIIKGDVAGGGKSIWMTLLMPALSLAGLLAFFLMRRRKNGTQTAA